MTTRRRRLVSITMPAYNYGCYVEQAVRSAFTQTYPNLELVAVDDGSTDDTLAILERLARESPFPMKVVRGQHRGVSAALNLALDHASGDFVSMLHADDWYREDKVEKQMALIEYAPEVVVVHSEYVSVDRDGKPMDHGSWLDLPPASGNALRDLLHMQRDVRSPTMLMRRSALEQIGRYDETLPVEDWQSILGLSNIGRVAHVDEPLVFRRLHGANISFQTHRGQHFSFDEFGYSVLRKVIPPDMPFDDICALHAGIALHTAVGQGGWRKARHGYAECWRAFPGGRNRLIKSALGGARTYVWINLLMPRLPQRAVSAIRRLRGRRAFA